MNYSRLTCHHCGGNMEIINMYSDHYLCDTCDYEINLDGVINKGIWDRGDDEKMSQIDKTKDIKNIAKLIDTVAHASNIFARLYPCSTCLNVKYSFDGKNMIKICDQDCKLIKQYYEAYQSLQKLFIDSVGDKE